MFVTRTTPSWCGSALGRAHVLQEAALVQLQLLLWLKLQVRFPKLAEQLSRAAARIGKLSERLGRAWRHRRRGEESRGSREFALPDFANNRCCERLLELVLLGYWPLRHWGGGRDPLLLADHANLQLLLEPARTSLLGESDARGLREQLGPPLLALEGGV